MLNMAQQIRNRAGDQFLEQAVGRVPATPSRHGTF
jgi:hypothetical protein